jgi:hypothetical protein
MVLRKVVTVFALVVASLFGVASANAKAFYISGASTRTTGGTSCGDALSVAWFNNTSSWGSASHQISPGTTVFLCGRFQGKPGQQLLIARGNGTASAPITIKFMPGTILSAPYWSGSGAIMLQDRSYITVDGTNGIIENTANGTGRAYRQNSVAVNARSCQHCTVQNLVIQNLYVRTSATDLAPTHTIHCVYWHLSNYMTVNNITCHDAAWAVAGDGNNFTMSNSHIYHVDHGVAFGAVGKMGGFSIHHNHFHDFANWDSPTNTYHHDGIHMWGQNGGTIAGGAIYSNTFDGDFGANITAHIFLQESVQNVKVYNNIAVAPITRTINSIWFYAPSTSLRGGPATGNSAYNNSVNAGGHRAGSAIMALNQLQFTAVNNIMGGGVVDVSLQGATTLTSTGVNNNVYRDLFAEFGNRNTFSYKGKYFYAIAQWRAACHCDSASKLILGSQTPAFSAKTMTAAATVAGAPVAPAGVAASGVYDPAAAAADAVNMAVVSAPTTKDEEFALLYTVGEGNGINLTELAVDDLAPLALDKNGVARPASGPWNVGPF